MSNTITPTPLAVFSSSLSARTWNLLVRNGLGTLPLLRQALADGLRAGDIKGLGPVALLEIRLALNNLPEDAPEPPASTPSAPTAEIQSGLSERELSVVLTLAEAGMSEDGFAGKCSWDEAYAALVRLRALAAPIPARARALAEPDPENNPASYTPESYPRDFQAIDLARTRPALTQPDPPVPQRPEPEPVDDDYEGYVIDTKPNGLNTWDF